MVVTVGDVTALAESKYGVVLLLEQGLSEDELVDGVPDELVAPLCSRMNPSICGTSLHPWETRLRARAREVALLPETGPYPTWYADTMYYVEVGVLGYAHVTKTGAALWCVVKSLKHDCVLDLDRFHPLGSASYILSRTHKMIMEEVIFTFGELYRDSAVFDSGNLSRLPGGGFVLCMEEFWRIHEIPELLYTAIKSVAESVLLTHRYGGPNDAYDRVPFMELLMPASGGKYVWVEPEEVLAWAKAYLQDPTNLEGVPTVVVGRNRLGVEPTVRWMLRGELGRVRVG